MTTTTITLTPADDPVEGADLATIRQNILNRIAEITAAPKPNYSVDGQQVSWQSYLDSLMKSLRSIDEQIQLSQEPFEIVSQGVT